LKYTCLLVDDENLALRLLEYYVNKIPQLTIIGKCQNALSALQILQTQQIDILFLDIQMPDLTGIELIKILKNKLEIILTTAYAEHALEGYQLDVTDYLLKPIPFERFVQAVNKAMEYRNLRNAGASNIQSNKCPCFSCCTCFRLYVC
jgi:DNA-binding LytR/AlgR family response regulator